MDLREARFRQGLTQMDIYVRTGIHQSEISTFEKGYKVPSAKKKEKINKALNVKLDWTDESGK